MAEFFIQWFLPGLQEWLGLKDWLSKHTDYSIQPIIFLVFISPSPVNQELCWVILHASWWHPWIHKILQDYFMYQVLSYWMAVELLCLVFPSFKNCARKYLQYREDTGITETILNVGWIFRPSCQRHYLSEEPKAWEVSMTAVTLLLVASLCFGIRIFHCYFHLFSPKHGNQGI